MGFYSRKNLIISPIGPNSLLLQPTTNGAVLVFDALLGSFVPPYTGPIYVEGINEGSGVPVLENQINQDLFFNTLVPGYGMSISQSDGEITISSQTPVKVVANSDAQDALTGLGVGQLVFVQDTGQGENALYMWNGTTFTTIATQNSAATDARTLEANISFSSSSPVSLGRVGAGARVSEVSVLVEQTFNGTSPTLTIGDMINGISVIMGESMNDLTITGEYGIDISYYYPGPLETDVYIFLNAGGSTQGQAMVTITYV